MARCLCKVVLQLTLYCCSFLLAKALPDTASLPAALQRELQSLQQKDNLEQWLYARIDYVEAAPATRVGFLMETQQAAWRKYVTYDERLAWFNLLILQGYYQLQTGNILSSINAYEAALEFYEAYPLPDADNIIDYLLKPLGNNYTRLGDYHTALFIHRKTLALAQQAKNDREIAATYSNMAICARWKGDWPLAMQYCRAGMEKAGRRTPLYGLLLNIRAELLTEQGHYDTAARVIAQAVPHLRQYQKDQEALYWYGSALQIAARIASAQGRYPAATQYARQAQHLFGHHFPATRQREKAQIQELLGWIALGTGQPQAALQHFQQSLQWLLPGWQPASLTAAPPDSLLYSESVLTDALAGKGASLRILNQREAALDHYMTVFQAGRQLQAAYLYTGSRLSELQLAKHRADAAMQLAYGLWKDTRQQKYQETLLLIAELTKAQVLADERAARFQQDGNGQAIDSLTRQTRQWQEAVVYYQRELATAPGNQQLPGLLAAAEYELSLLTKKIRQENEDTPAGQLWELSQLPHCWQRLPAGVTALEFFAGADSSYLIEMDARGVQDVWLITGSASLQDTIQQFMQHWFMQGPAAMMNDPQSFYRQCHAIYSAAFAGYQWKQGQRYLLIPDGGFSYLPFDALVTHPQYTPDFSRWPFLCRQAALSQAWSLQTWYQQQITRYPGHSFSGFFVSKGKGQPQSALSVLEEYQLLQDMVKGDYYLDSMATWQNFTSHTRGRGVVHMSTHAVSAQQDPFPYLQLYDQPFYLFDLRYRSFAPALVVLGACKTADGQWLAGEGVNSLARGFTASGAGGVVSGLWNVNDAAAIKMMQAFYRRMQQVKDPSLALHEAKLHWMANTNGQATRHLPYYWAGFVYSGRLQPVVLEQPPTPGWWYAAGGICLAIIGIILYWKRRL